ncbi:hypothetical protein OS493_004507 [Desmophyllum pertusum]|uniref:L-gulonolactone oxidase n=1 Tax=Desmophyllum pertusum TaxID=174260 RepID=A0A9X0CYT0_9CNID|nr:hypothetical protein OS493_004507 [Desmophyllum pertusum]
MEHDFESGVEEVLARGRGQRGYKFTNWSTTYSCTPDLYFEPETIEDIREILQAAVKLRKSVRVVGGGHSPSDIVCTKGYMISLKNYKAVLEINHDKQQVTVQAGLTIVELNELLNDHGLALSTLSSVSEMSCAGTIGTCTHGTGKDFGLLATMVVALELMKADGEVIYCSRDQNKEIFLAALCSLGALGVILSVTWQCEPAFRLHQLCEPVTLEKTLENLETSLSSSEHFRFFWYPHTGYVTSYNVNRTNKPIEDNPSWFWDYAVGYYSLEFMLWLSSFVSPLVRFLNWGHFQLFQSKPRSRVNQSYKVFNFDCLFKQYVSEWAIPQNQTVYVLRELQSWFSDSGFNAHFPVEVRFVKKDDIYMSPCYEQDMCFINIISFRPYDKSIPHEKYWTFFEDLMMSVGGKPHWAKAHKCDVLANRETVP